MGQISAISYLQNLYLYSYTTDIYKKSKIKCSDNSPTHPMQNLSFNSPIATVTRLYRVPSLSKTLDLA